jgi:hypothetical protein
MFGKTILKSKTPNYSFNLDMNTLNKGIYLFKIELSKNILSYKIIVN